MKNVRKTTSKAQENDLAFWLTKSALERIQALEELRRRYIKFFGNESDRLLQRVCTITSQKQG
jgi:hypothetical protein